MDNFLTPEEANTPVTFGNLMAIIDEFNKNYLTNAERLQNEILKILDIVTDGVVSNRDDAEYKRQRDLRYILGLIATIEHLDKDAFYENYKNWCEEFDNLNKSKVNSEDINE